MPIFFPIVFMVVFMVVFPIVFTVVIPVLIVIRSTGTSPFIAVASITTQRRIPVRRINGVAGRA